MALALAAEFHALRLDLKRTLMNEFSTSADELLEMQPFLGHAENLAACHGGHGGAVLLPGRIVVGRCLLPMPPAVDVAPGRAP